MTITYNDKYVDIFYSYLYDSSSDTYSFGKLDGKDSDFFIDSAVVGDAIVFTVDRSETEKFNEIKFDVATPLVADSITVIWEYFKVYPNRWEPLINVVDGTNAFQIAGINSVTFDCPEDWENYGRPGDPVKFYGWNIRCRIVSVSNLTEGGKQSSSSIVVKPNIIWVSEFTEEIPCTMQDIYDADVTNGWGVVTKNGNLYTLNCGLKTDKTTGYFITKQEVIQFLKNWDCWFYGKIVSGEVVSGDKCRYGSTFIFNLYNGDLGGFLVLDYAEIYNTTYKYIAMEGSHVQHGHWGGSLGNRDDQKIYDVYGEGFRQFDFAKSTNAIMGIKGYGFHVETPGAILKNITCYGGHYSVRPLKKSSGSYMHECDFSNVTWNPINPWQNTSDNDDFVMYFVDCNWGTFDKSDYAFWRDPGVNNAIYLLNSFLLKVIDKNNNTISGAKIVLKDKNGIEVFNYITSTDGYIGQACGSISSATEGTLIDSSKNWTSNEWHFKEVYITSGKGIGQKRIIKKGNTATELQVAPNWDTIPDITSKYIIIPYVKTLKLEPEIPEYVGKCYSIYSDYNPFSLKVSKAGYESYKQKFVLDKKINWTVTLKRISINVDNEVIV